MKTSKVVFLVLLFYVLPSTGWAGVTPSQEMSLSRIVIPFFSIKVQDSSREKLWNEKKSLVQEALFKEFGDRTSIEPILSIKSYDIDADSKDLISESKGQGSDSLLLGEYHDSEVLINIVSGITGRSLEKIKVPLSDTLAQNPNDLASTIVSVLLSKIKYVGVITATHNSEAKINVGSKQGLAVGSVLILFDFDGPSPTFSSRLHRVGFIKITKISDYGAIGTITPVAGVTSIQLFTKVAIPRQRPAPKTAAPQVAKSNSQRNRPPVKETQGVWVEGSIGFYSLNAQVKGSGSSLMMRNFQVPLSPAGKLGFGFSKFSLEALYSMASNSSNSLTVIQSSALYQILSSSQSSVRLSTLGGIYFSQFGVTPSSNPTTLLVSATTFSPEIQERAQYSLSEKSNIYGALDLFYPIFSNDSANGSSQVTGSYGLGLEAGYRYIFSAKWTGDLNLQSHYFSIQNQSGQIAETEYNLTLGAIYNF